MFGIGLETTDQGTTDFGKIIEITKRNGNKHEADTEFSLAKNTKGAVEL